MSRLVRSNADSSRIYWPNEDTKAYSVTRQTRVQTGKEIQMGRQEIQSPKDQAKVRNRQVTSSRFLVSGNWNTKARSSQAPSTIFGIWAGQRGWFIYCGANEVKVETGESRLEGQVTAGQEEVAGCESQVTGMSLHEYLWRERWLKGGTDLFAQTLRTIYSL